MRVSWVMSYCETIHSSHPIQTVALLLADPVVSQSRLLSLEKEKINKKVKLDN